MPKLIATQVGNKDVMSGDGGNVKTLKPGLYKHVHEEYGRYAGEIVLDIHETKTAFILRLVENTVRYDAPQIDDMFRESDRCVIKKNGSKHAMNFCEGQDDWLCLYPYRVGTPYAFEHVDSIRAREEWLKARPPLHRNSKGKCRAGPR